MLVQDAGRRIALARERARLSQAELAERSKVSPWTISDLETGRNTSPRRRTLYALCEHIDLDADSLFTVEVAS